MPSIKSRRVQNSNKGLFHLRVKRGNYHYTKKENTKKKSIYHYSEKNAVGDAMERIPSLETGSQR